MAQTSKPLGNQATCATSDNSPTTRVDALSVHGNTAWSHLHVNQAPKALRLRCRTRFDMEYIVSPMQCARARIAGPIMYGRNRVERVGRILISVLCQLQWFLSKLHSASTSIRFVRTRSNDRRRYTKQIIKQPAAMGWEQHFLDKYIEASSRGSSPTPSARSSLDSRIRSSSPTPSNNTDLKEADELLRRTRGGKHEPSQQTRRPNTSNPNNSTSGQ